MRVAVVDPTRYARGGGEKLRSQNTTAATLRWSDLGVEHDYDATIHRSDELARLGSFEFDAKDYEEVLTRALPLLRED